MAFPTDPVSITVTIAFDGSTPVDVSAYVRREDEITHGFWRTQSGVTADASTLKFVLQAPRSDPGLFNPFDPASQYWQQAGWIGAPVVFVVEGTTMFTGKISRTAPYFELAGDGVDGYCTVEAAGPLQWLTSEPVVPPMRAGILADLPWFYWPLEDGADSTQLEEASGYGSPGTWTGTLNLAAAGPDSSKPVTSFGSDDVVLNLPIPATAPPNAWSVECLFRVPSAPSDFVNILTWETDGAARFWFLTLIPGDPLVTLRLECFTSSWVNLASETTMPYANLVYGTWYFATVSARDNGSGGFTWDAGIESTEYGFSLSAPSAISGSTGIVNLLRWGWQSPPSGWNVGHISVWSSDLGSYSGTPFDHWTLLEAFAGELAHVRFARVLDGLLVDRTNDTASTTTLGAQQQESPRDILLALETADQGRLGDTAGGLVSYQSQQARYEATTAAFTLTAAHLSNLLPVGEVDRAVGDVRVERLNGTAVRLRDDAVMSRGGTSRTLNQVQLGSDAGVLPLAQFVLAEGSVTDAPITTIPINLATDDGSLITNWLAAIAQAGPVRVAADAVAGVLPDGGDFFLEGGQQRFTDTGWDADLVVSSAAPYRRFLRASTTRGRRDSTRSIVASDATSSATTLVVATPTAPNQQAWTLDSDSYPIPVLAAGERVTLTEPPTHATDAFGRTVANGWGSADSGEAWTTTNTASRFSVGSGVAAISMADLSTDYWITIPSPRGDRCMRVDVTFPAVPGGSYPAVLRAGLVARYVSDTWNYLVTLDLAPTGALTLTAWRGSTTYETTYDTYDLGTYTAGTTVRLWAQAEEWNLRAAAAVGGTTWPGWLIDYENWEHNVIGPDASTCGMFAYNSSPSTESVTFDNFDVPDIQTFANVTRGVNAVTKAQTAGGKFSLWRPGVRGRA